MSRPIFRAVNKGGRVLAERLSAQSVALVVKHRVAAAKLDPALFAAHSLRAGLVTSALESGADVLKVMAVTRHRSVDTLKKYDRRAKAFADHAGKSFLELLRQTQGDRKDITPTFWTRATEHW